MKSSDFGTRGHTAGVTYAIERSKLGKPKSVGLVPAIRMRLFIVLLCVTLATSQTEDDSNENTIDTSEDVIRIESVTDSSVTAATSAGSTLTVEPQLTEKMSQAKVTTQSPPSTTELTESSDTEDTSSDAMAELAEAVRSLLPLREYMAVAAECREGREQAMQTVISELRGRLAQLERQLSETQHEEQTCKAEFQAFRALGLEKQLADCRSKEQEAHITVRIAAASGCHVEQDSSEEGGESAGNSKLNLEKLLTNALQSGGASANGDKISEIYTIAKETKLFMESLQESENEDQAVSEELARVSVQLNVSESVQLQLREEIATLKQQTQCSSHYCDHVVAEATVQCQANISAGAEECTTRCALQVESSVTTAQADCDAESARLQREGVSYIMQLHTECNTTLSDAQLACEQEKEAYLAKLNAMNIERNYSLVVSMQTKCDEDKRDLVKTKEAECEDMTAMVSSHCEAKIANIASTADAETMVLKAALNASQRGMHNLRDETECKGFNDEVMTNLTEPGLNEFSFRMGDRLYIVGENNVSAGEAWQLCREKEMWLLTLETHEELQDLKPRIQMLATGHSGTDHVVWVAARHDVTHAWFFSECGGSRFVPWGAHQFGEAGSQCVVLNFPRQLGGSATWSNVECDRKHQYVCEALLED